MHRVGHAPVRGGDPRVQRPDRTLAPVHPSLDLIVQVPLDEVVRGDWHGSSRDLMRGESPESTPELRDYDRRRDVRGADGHQARQTHRARRHLHGARVHRGRAEGRLDPGCDGANHLAPNGSHRSQVAVRPALVYLPGPQHEVLDLAAVQRHRRETVGGGEHARVGCRDVGVIGVVSE